MRELNYKGMKEGILLTYTDHMCTVGVDDPVNFIVFRDFEVVISNKQGVLIRGPQMYEVVVMPPGTGFSNENIEVPYMRTQLSEGIECYSKLFKGEEAYIGLTREQYDHKVCFLEDFEKDILLIILSQLVGDKYHSVWDVFSKDERARRSNRTDDAMIIHKDILRVFGVDKLGG